VKRNLWVKIFAEEAIPAFPCPHCAVGSLGLTKEGVLFKEGNYTKANRKANRLSEDWDPGHQTERFTAFLQCTHTVCGEIVAIAGEVETVEEYVDDVQVWGLTRALRPQVFFPAPPIITVPENTPKEVKTPLLKAFQLFWSDDSASANKIRVSVEALLTHLKVPRYNKPKQGKHRRPLPLDVRIKRFGQLLNNKHHTRRQLTSTSRGPQPAGNNPQPKPAKHPYEILLHALRVVGNVGSHKVRWTAK
jgi:hypothetical protein